MEWLGFVVILIGAFVGAWISSCYAHRLTVVREELRTLREKAEVVVEQVDLACEYIKSREQGLIDNYNKCKRFGTTIVGIYFGCAGEVLLNFYIAIETNKEISVIDNLRMEIIKIISDELSRAKEEVEKSKRLFFLF